MRIKICPICATVSGTWLVLTAGIVFGLLKADDWKLLVAIAMGGSVVGIADRVKRQKLLIVGAGTASAFLALRNLNLWVWVLEIAALVIIGYMLFTEKESVSRPKNTQRELEKKLKECC